MTVCSLFFISCEKDDEDKVSNNPNTNQTISNEDILIGVWESHPKGTDITLSLYANHTYTEIMYTEIYRNGKKYSGTSTYYGTWEYADDYYGGVLTLMQTSTKWYDPVSKKETTTTNKTTLTWVITTITTNGWIRDDGLTFTRI